MTPRREAGLGSLEYIGLALVASTVIGGIAIAVAPGPIAATVRYAVCTITGGDCVAPLGVPKANADEPPACSPGMSGPLGATRSAFQVSIGSGRTALVEQTGGGAFRIVAPLDGAPLASWPAASAATSRIDALAGARRSALYTAGSVQEASDVLGGLGRQGVHDRYFGTGGSPVADVWSDAGDGLLDGLGMSQRTPSQPSTFTAADLADQPSSYAYDLALSLGDAGPGILPLGSAHREDGSWTQYLTASVPLGDGRAAEQFVVELERDHKGYLTGVRTTSAVERLTVAPDGRVDAVGQGATHVVGLRVSTAADAQVASDLLASLGVQQPIAYAAPVAPRVTTPASAATVGPALDAFRTAAVTAGTVTRQPYSPGHASPAALTGPVLEPDALAAAVTDASKSTASGELWNGTAWQPWSGCA